MLDIKEQTVSNRSRSALEKRRVSGKPTKAVAGSYEASAQTRRQKSWSEVIDQDKLRYVSEPNVAPQRRAVTTRKPTAAPNGRLARSEARLMSGAIAAMITVCGALVLYLCSYAHISSLGMREAQARVHLRQLQADNETLLAEYATLRSPARISAAAIALKMQNIPPSVTYIDLSRAAAPVEANASGLESNTSINNGTGIKVAGSGTTREKSEPTGTI